MESVPLLAWCTSLEGKGGIRVDMYICVSVYYMYIIHRSWTMPDVLAKDLLWPSLSISFDIFLFLTFVYFRKLSCHVFTHMTTMASITFSTFIFSSQLGIQDWKKYEISFKLKKQGAMKHMSGEVCRPFFFFNDSVLYGDPPVTLGVELLRGFWRVVPVSQDDGSSAWVRWGRIWDDDLPKI